MALLAAELRRQTAFDRACAEDLEAIPLDADSRAQIDEGARAFTAKRGEGRTQVGKHAAFAVGVGFLLLDRLARLDVSWPRRNIPRRGVKDCDDGGQGDAQSVRSRRGEG